MEKAEVIDLMKSSRSVSEWNENCDKVIEAYGDKCPDFWHEAILDSGVAAETIKKFDSHIKTY